MLSLVEGRRAEIQGFALYFTPVGIFPPTEKSIDAQTGREAAAYVPLFSRLGLGKEEISPRHPRLGTCHER